MTILLGILVYLSSQFDRKADKVVEAMGSISKRQVVNVGDKYVCIEGSAWGLLGDHQRIRISEDSSEINDTSKCFTIYSGELYYKVSHDTFSLYVCDCKLKKPLKHFKKVVVEHIDLNNYDKTINMEKSYRSRGIHKFELLKP
ncbi:MAG: hypothetical protein ACKOXF_12270 [Chitinophagaceae bacterium]